MDCPKIKTTGPYIQAYARNCEVRRVDKLVARPFLDANHRLGYTNCRFFYGLYLKNTGYSGIQEGTLLAVSGFSGPRRWDKGGRVVSSYEWVRYASLPDVRVDGGMGKMLKTFIDEHKPDDVMSYADLSWSEGDAYRKLGFVEEGKKEIEGKAGSLKFRLRLYEEATEISAD